MVGEADPAARAAADGSSERRTAGRAGVHRLRGLDLDELHVSFLGRPDLDQLWKRVQAGTVRRVSDELLVLLAESRAHERAGRLAEAARTAELALDLAVRHDDTIGRAGAESHLAYAYYRMGRPGDATELAERSLAIATPHAHTVTAQLVLGLIAVDACHWDEARRRFDTARGWSSEIDYPLGVMLALHNLSVMYFHTGRFDLAVGAANDVDRLNQEIQYPGWAYPWTRAIVAQLTGDRAGARSAVAQLESMRPVPAFAVSLGRMLTAQLALDEDDVDEAERALGSARVAAERLGNPMARAMVLLVTSRVRRTRGDAASAEGWIEEAINEVNRAGIASLQGWMQLELARVRWALGDRNEAERVLREAIETADRRSAAHIGAEATLLLAMLLGESGAEQATATWVEAARRMRSGGYGFMLERERGRAMSQVVTLARRGESDPRQAGQHLLDLLATATPVPLHVTGLGRFEVRQGRRMIDTGELRKRRAGMLLRFLLLQRNHRASRDVIVDALWADQTDGAAAQLHQATSHLRRALEPDLPDKFPSRYLHIKGESIELALPPGSSVDFARFEADTVAALRDPERSATALDAALALYDGELYPDDHYADWSAVARVRLHELAARAGAVLAAGLIDDGRVHDALAVASLAIERDPVREQAVVVAIRAALALGDRTTAVRLYRACERRLADDLGVRPTAELLDLGALIGA